MVAILSIDQVDSPDAGTNDVGDVPADALRGLPITVFSEMTGFVHASRLEDAAGNGKECSFVEVRSVDGFSTSVRHPSIFHRPGQGVSRAENPSGSARADFRR